MHRLFVPLNQQDTAFKKKYSGYLLQKITADTDSSSVHILMPPIIISQTTKMCNLHYPIQPSLLKYLLLRYGSATCL